MQKVPPPPPQKKWIQQAVATSIEISETTQLHCCPQNCSTGILDKVELVYLLQYPDISLIIFP